MFGMLIVGYELYDLSDVIFYLVVLEMSNWYIVLVLSIINGM